VALIAQAPGGRLTARDLAGATLAQAGGALVVRLADGRVIVVPSYFPHEQPPLPSGALPAGAVIVPVDDYYAAVAGVDPVGADAAPGVDPAATASPEAIAASTSPAAGPGAGAAPGSAAATSTGDSGGPAGFRSASDGAGGLVQVASADASLAAPRFAGGSLTDAGGSGGSTAAGTDAGAADPGPQPPALLAGLPLFAGLGAAVDLGSVGAPGGAAPVANVNSGNTGGNTTILRVFEFAGTYTLAAKPTGYTMTRGEDGVQNSVGYFVSVQFEIHEAAFPSASPPAGPSTLTIPDPGDWMFLRSSSHDNRSGEILVSAIGGSRSGVPAATVSFVSVLIDPDDGNPPVNVFAAAAAAAGVAQYSVQGGTTITLGDPQDPNLIHVLGPDAGFSAPRPMTTVVSDANLYDFHGLDGTRWFNVDEFDAFNGVASALTFDRAFLDGITAPLRAIGDPAGPTARFFSVRADTNDSVAFADPGNWAFEGLLANDTQIQYRAIGTAEPLFVTMSRFLAARPAYNFAGGAGDDTVIVPDMGFGAIDGGGGVNTLRVLSGSFDFTALGPGQSVSRVNFIDSTFTFVDPLITTVADTVTVNAAFASAAAQGGQLTLIGDPSDSAVIADYDSNWRQLGTFQDDPLGFTADFVEYESLIDGTRLNVQAELAALLPLRRIGGAGDDVLPVEATAKRQTIDGLGGFDRLQPAAAGAIDLTALAPGSTVRNVEALDLRGQGANALTLDDVFVADSTVDGVLSVLGEAGDSLTLTGGWTKTGSFPVGAQVFDRWQATTPLGEAVTAFVDQQIQTQAP
jgi:hypothetical protein